MQVLLYQQQIDDKIHNVKFAKDKVSYRHKTFDAVIEKKFRPVIKNALDSGLSYPLILELEQDDYFTKLVSYKRNDGTNGTKFKIVIGNAQEIKQGEFETKSMDEICDEIEEESAKKAVE